jgi:hypothetical protein
MKHLMSRLAWRGMREEASLVLWEIRNTHSEVLAGSGAGASRHASLWLAIATRAVLVSHANTAAGTIPRTPSNNRERVELVEPRSRTTA